MYKIEVPFEATSKELNFLSDPELAQIIKTILFEIDNITVIRAHRSMIYLSMSILEGILSNVLALNEIKIKSFPNYPKKNNALKKLDELVLAEKIAIAKDLGIIASEFFDTFKKFKEFRNYMHPLKEVTDKQPLDIGLAQVALGLMNHTISKLERIRFINEKTWRVISGIPIYNSHQNKIEFKLSNLPTHSFVVTGDYVNNNAEIYFELHIGDHAVFNFVYNYESEESFNMLRFDTRKTESSGILYCGNKYGWHMIEKYNSKWYIKTKEPNKVKVRIESGGLRIYLNDKEELTREITINVPLLCYVANKTFPLTTL